jgi:hypothetical protein
MLESFCHLESWFVTLTYAPEFLPVVDGVQTLVPKHLQAFLKRVRADVGPGLRFFAVGEYGSVSKRPHYHAILFGLDSKWLELDTKRGELRFSRPGWWPWGFHSIGEFLPQRASYVAHYCTKKMTKEDAKGLEPGQFPEFSRMSRRPGIGHPFVSKLAELYQLPHGRAELAEVGDIRKVLRIDRSTFPIDRTMQRYLRDFLGVPQAAIDRYPLPIEHNPIFRVRTDEEQAEAVRKHDQAYRRLKGHGTV